VRSIRPAGENGSQQAESKQPTHRIDADLLAE
jgi:hypothetical protein